MTPAVGTRRGRAGGRPVALALLPALLLVALLLSTGGAASGAGNTQRGAAEMTFDDVLALAHPGPPVWSPRGDRIAFLRELDGAVDLWWTSEDLDEPRAVTAERGREPPRAVTGFAWTADGEGLVYALGGDLYFHDVAAASSRPLAASEASESGPALSADGSRIAYLLDGRPWVGSFPQMDGEPIAAAPDDLRSLLWSPDGRYLAATFDRGETVFEDTAALMGDKLRFTRRREVEAGLLVLDLEGGAVHELEAGPAYASQPAFSPAGTLAWQEIAADARGRDIRVAAAPDWAPRTVVHETDEAFWTLTYLDAGPRWSPVGERFAFISERDGWAHAWLLDLSGEGEPVPLTRGDFEVEEPAWSPDGARLLLAANRGSSDERGLHLLEVPETVGEPPELVPISRLRGTSIAGRWRPDGEAIAFLHADPESPLDLWVQAPGPHAAEQLTDTWPEDLDEEGLVRPQRARFSSADGTLVPAQLFLPPEEARGDGPLPALVWVHGGGIRQNRYGWHPMRADAVFYGFHQYLLQRGYAVVTVDYRGSIGYGRAFRQGHFRDLGGRDLDDVLAAVRYLRRIEEVEIGRIGVWGISYGGYLTLQALVQAPTAFDAGVNVAGVADWADWAVDPGGLWIDGRIGDPAEHAELLRARSPIHRVAQLARPLLILHGTADRNVPALQAFALTDALVRAGRPFDVVVYPGEQHAFVRARTWKDAFARIERFFDAHLR